jgi:ABC-type lipoprotein export system ATPase subunit
MLLQLENVCKTYRGQQQAICALDGVSLALDAGEFVAVCGPSGCGKSTLLLTIGGLLAPDSGSVVLHGENPYEMPPNARAEFRSRSVGFVFQQFHLVPYLSILDNVLAPALAVSHSKEDVKQRALQLIEHFGLSDRLQHVPSELSSGERQRTALARALLNQPKLLLADEPTGNLDRESAEIVLGHLKEFAERGGAVLLVTHDDRAVTYADRTIPIRAGRIEQARHDEPAVSQSNHP